MKAIMFLTPVDLAERCFLKELLLWVAFQRLPEYFPGEDGDVRFGYDHAEYDPYFGEYLITGLECEFAGITVNPTWLDEDGLLDPAHYDRLLEIIGLEEAERLKYRELKERAVVLSRAEAHWEKEYESYTDYHKAGIFRALREGKIQASGVKVEGTDCSEVEEWIDQNEIYCSLEHHVPIPAQFWVSSGINWASSAAVGAGAHYIWICFDVREMLDTFLPPFVEPIGSIIPLGRHFIAVTSSPISQSKANRGRPPHLGTHSMLKWPVFCATADCHQKKRRLSHTLRTGSKSEAKRSAGPHCQPS